MIRKDDLFDLVHSMSRSEKRYFKLNNSTQQGDKQYLKLFNILQKSEEYDEAAILKSLEKGISNNRYKFLKNYLYNSILASLQQLYNKTDTGQLKGQLQKVKILFNKGLYGQSRKTLKRAKKLSLNYDDYLTLLEIIRLEKDLLSKEKDQTGFLLKSNLLHEEEQSYLLKLKQVNESNHLFTSVKYLYITFGHPRSEKELKRYQAIFDNPLFKLLDEEHTPPHKVKVNLLVSRIIFNMCLYDHGNHYYFARQLLEHYKQHESKIFQYPNDYLSAISYFLKSSAYLYKKDAFENALGEIRSFEQSLPANKKNKSLSANIFFTTYYNELFFYLQNCHVKNCLGLLPEIEQGLETFKGQLNNTEKIYLTYLISLVHFGSGNFSESLEWFNHILNSYKSDSIPHVYLRIRLMLLINHFELGHTRLLEPLVISTYRYLLKKRKMYQYESAVIRFIRKLPQLASQSQLDELFVELLQELIEIVKDPFEYAGCAWFVFWLEGKEAGIGLEEVFENKTPEKNKKPA